MFLVEVPAQEWLAAWQSFTPALAIPYHFSAWKFGTAAGPACAITGTAMAASMAEAAIIEVFIGSSPVTWVRSVGLAVSSARPLPCTKDRRRSDTRNLRPEERQR